ncbi:hypothetical protein M9H77_07991 [Catharanthus roseus]|uniref:Uncharacterized protein n=1 Tax=Catharanthus roseus TaxID=4058 RepID=A0ACC0BWI3_CATRO|nr:hypothetical protein M9H77_07991 [Catharanthus roseus]
MSEYIACTTSTQVVLEYYCYVYKIMNEQMGGLASLILLMIYWSFHLYIFSSPCANCTTCDDFLSSLDSQRMDFPTAEVKYDKLGDAIKALPLETSEFKFSRMIYSYRTFQSVLDKMPEKCRIIYEVTKTYNNLVDSFDNIKNEHIVEKENIERQNYWIKEIRDEIERLQKELKIAESSVKNSRTHSKAQFWTSIGATRETSSGDKPMSTEAEHEAEKPTSIEAENADSVTSLSTMQISSVVVDIDSSHTLAEQDSHTSSFPIVEEKRLDDHSILSS